MSEMEVVRALVGFPWIVFLVYWILGAIKTRVTRQKESFASRYIVVLIETVGYVLVFSDSAEIGFLGDRFIPRTLAGVMVGIAFTWLGIGLAIWGRYHLAEYWSARVARHPIYTGLILAAIGWAVVVDKWRCVIGVCLVLAGYCVKARKEEAMLSQQFGEAFREHQKHAGFLVPRFR